MKHLRRWDIFLALWMFATLLAVTGCKTDHAAKVAESLDSSNGAPATSRIDSATTGVVSGTAHFAGKAPERVRIDMSQDPACNTSGVENDSEQYVVHDGGLANVFVYVKSGLHGMAYARPSTPVVLDQKGCRYVPHVVGAMVGQTVEFRNSDPTMHNVHTMPAEAASGASNQQVDISEGPMGAAQTATFKHPELMMPVRCNNHPWMEAFVNVVDSPFFAVTDANGHFEIKGLPPGTYTIAAVHEKLGEETATVTVSAQKTTPASFSFAMK